VGRSRDREKLTSHLLRALKVLSRDVLKRGAVSLVVVVIQGCIKHFSAVFLSLHIKKEGTEVINKMEDEGEKMMKRNR